MQNLPYEYLQSFSQKELKMFCKRNVIIQQLNKRAEMLDSSSQMLPGIIPNISQSMLNEGYKSKKLKQKQGRRVNSQNAY